MKQYLILLVLQLLKTAHSLPTVTIGTIAVSDARPPANISQIQNGCDKNSCEGRIWMFYDNHDSPAQWGTLASINANEYDHNVICKQLGYNNSEPLQHHHEDNVQGSVLFAGVTCSKRNTDPLKHNNILQCPHNLCINNNPSCDHKYDIKVHCVGEPEHYQGEFFLCAPQQRPYGVQTVMGLTQLYLDKETKSISINSAQDVVDHFPQSTKDTMCRSMGFTHTFSESLHIISAAEKYHNYSFSAKCIKNPWFDIRRLHHCNDKSTESSSCFRCCYDYNRNFQCNMCSPENSSVIACSFDPLDIEIKEHGNRLKCELKENDDIPDHTSTCGGNKWSPTSAFGITLAVSVILLPVICITVLCRKVIWKKIKNKCRHYEKVTGDNQGENKQEK